MKFVTPTHTCNLAAEAAPEDDGRYFSVVTTFGQSVAAIVFSFDVLVFDGDCSLVSHGLCNPQHLRSSHHDCPWLMQSGDEHIDIHIGLLLLLIWIHMYWLCINIGCPRLMQSTHWGDTAALMKINAAHTPMTSRRWRDRSCGLWQGQPPQTLHLP